MSRRSNLIDDYLRAHDPLRDSPERPEEQASAPSRAARRPASAGGRRASAGGRGVASTGRRWPAVGGGVLAAAGLAAALVIGGAFAGNGSRRDPITAILTPQQAIAAVSDDLANGSVLHWVQHEQTGPDHDSGGTVEFVNRSDQWVDLTTGATHGTATTEKYTNGKPSPGAGVSPETWFDGKQTTIALYPADFFVGAQHRRIVMRTTNFAIRGRHAKHYSPIADVQRLLQRAVDGRAALRPAGTYQGIPVVKVVEHQSVGAGTRRMTVSGYTWIVRSAQPRLLKFRMVTRDARGRLIHRDDLITDMWDVLPRTPEVLAHLTPPHFDPAKYKVRTQYLGPGSGKYKHRTKP